MEVGPPRDYSQGLVQSHARASLWTNSLAMQPRGVSGLGRARFSCFRRRCCDRHRLCCCLVDG
eukprot:9725938-Alexandrium_andersonii.AAC.1